MGIEAVLLVLSALPIWNNYAPTVENAYLSTQNMRGSYLPDSVHALSSGLLILHGALHVVACIWTGEYRNGPVSRWIAVIALWLLSFVGQVTGTVLPLDRHDAQTLAIETAVASQVPVLGSKVAEFMGGGSGFGQRSLGNWWTAHLAIGAGVLLLAILVLRTAVKDKDRSLRWVLPIGTVAIVGISALVAPPFGEKAEATDFSGYDARPGWYAWPLHGLLRMFSEIGAGWLGAAVVPALLAAFVVLQPWLNRKGSMAVDRLSLIAITMFLAVACIGFGGSFAPLTGSQDPPKAAHAGTQPAQLIDAALVERGRKLFGSVGCTGCHGIDGTKSIAGPDLTRVHEKFPDRDWYVRFIPNPKGMRPNTVMPPFDTLDKATLEALAEYLRNPNREPRQ